MVCRDAHCGQHGLTCRSLQSFDVQQKVSQMTHMLVLGGCCCARLVLSLRQEYLPGGVRTSQEEAKAAAVKAREVRWVPCLDPDYSIACQ